MEGPRRETAYENPWLRINLADVELPDGRHLDHYVIRQRAVAMATAVNGRNEHCGRGGG